MKKFFLVPFLFLILIFQGFLPDINPENNAIWHNSLGMEYMQQGDVSSAISEYKIAIALKAETSVSAAFHNNLGLAYLKIHKPLWAIVCFDNAISLNPNALYFYENLVNAYAQGNLLGVKYTSFKKKTSQNFENSYNWMMLGLIQKKRGDYKNAIKSFNNYILLEPELVVSQAVKTKIEEMKKTQF